MDFFPNKKVPNVRSWRKDLLSFCTNANLSFDHCNFHIENIKTVYGRGEYEVNHSFFEMEYDRVADEVVQYYDVLVSPREYDFSLLEVFIDPRYMRAVLHLKEGFLIDERDVYTDQFFDFVIASLVEKGVIIPSLESIRKTLGGLITQFEAPCVVVSEFKAEILSSNADFIPSGFVNLLETKWLKSNNESPIENAMYGVKRNEIIGYFSKSPRVRSGRNLKGDFVSSEELSSMYSALSDNSQAKGSKDSASKVDVVVRSAYRKYRSRPDTLNDLVSISEKDDRVIYRANASGYVEFSDGGIRLIDVATLKQVSRKTGCLLGGLERGLEVDIECHDNTKDAIENGAVIEAEVLNVTGNVGERVVLKTSRLSIKGQTHHDSVIYAKQAYITTHRGILYAEEVDIDRLELGRVYARDSAHITQCNGGSVSSKKIVISNLHSNTNVDFSELLHLKIVEGGKNKLSFNSFADSDLKSKMLALVKMESLLKDHVSSRVSYCKDLVEKLKKIKPIVQNLRPVVAQHKRDGIPLSGEVKKTLSYYVSLLKHIQVQRDLANKLHEDRIKNGKLAREMESRILDARITTEASWRDDNEIVLIKQFPICTRSNIFMEDSDMNDVAVSKDMELVKVDQA